MRDNFRQDRDQVRLDQAGMRIQPETPIRFAAGDMYFPDSVQRDGGTEVLYGLAAVTLIAQQVMEIEHDATVGGLGDLSRKLTVRNFIRARRQIADRGFEGDVQGSGGAPMAVKRTSASSTM